ncbi:hypothetical protein [Nonomuraea aurantiaca]|uniref:hypothetical protein n=1 Tax=Nonomuraea aurantiaca TaxID=2878562 RepID=UPI001CD9A4C1|nr:hypothetical protein [Nonomuraea aurantiaca]MCA2227887.1 hypothetical protein [Nonomuraea aurantiaca]
MTIGDFASSERIPEHEGCFAQSPPWLAQPRDWHGALEGTSKSSGRDSHPRPVLAMSPVSSTLREESQDMPGKSPGIGTANINPPAAIRGNGPLERVTVNLNERSSRALEEVVTLRGDTKTDAINRALQMYSLIEHILHGGGKIYVQEADQTELEQVRFF